MLPIADGAESRGDRDVVSVTVVEKIHVLRLKAAADATAVHCGLPALDPSHTGDAPTRAGQKEVARAAKPLRYEVTRRPRNAWTERITENAPVTPRT